MVDSPPLQKTISASNWRRTYHRIRNMWADAIIGRAIEHDDLATVAGPDQRKVEILKTIALVTSSAWPEDYYARPAGTGEAQRSRRDFSSEVMSCIHLVSKHSNALRNAIIDELSGGIKWEHGATIDAAIHQRHGVNPQQTVAWRVLIGSSHGSEGPAVIPYLDLPGHPITRRLVASGRALQQWMLGNATESDTDGPGSRSIRSRLTYAAVMKDSPAFH